MTAIKQRQCVSLAFIVQWKFKLSMMILVMYQLFLMTQYYNFKTKLALYHALETLAQLFDSFQYSTQYVLFPCCRHFLVFVNTDKYRFKKIFQLADIF